MRSIIIVMAVVKMVNANENVMLMIDLLTNGFQCGLNVQVLFPGALHTCVGKPKNSEVGISKN